MACGMSLLKTLGFGAIGAIGTTGVIVWKNTFAKVIGGVLAITLIPALYYGKDYYDCVSIKGHVRKEKRNK